MKYYYISSNKKKTKQKQKQKLIGPLTSKDAEHQELIAGESDKRQALWKTAW